MPEGDRGMFCENAEGCFLTVVCKFVSDCAHFSDSACLWRISHAALLGYPLCA